MGIAKGLITAFWLQLAFCVAVIVMISRARKGAKVPPIYKVPGLDAMDEAIGRATEMGRPVHFSPGIMGVQDAQTLAALAVLGYIAKKCAEYGTQLIATNKVTTVYPIAEAIVRQAFVDAGKADAFKPEYVRFISEDQFAYTTGVTAIMRRERPAANIMIGSFWAETIIIAENAFKAGAIQIAGTANTFQIQVLMVSCDYVLIGEEMYAATAYLTKEPVLLGSLIAQDWAKALAEGLIIVGALLETIKSPLLKNILSR